MKSPLLPVVSLAAVLAAGAPVSAQQARPERPYRGLFGGGVGDAQQLLTVDFSVGGGYDDNVLADQGLGGVPTTAAAGRFGDASAGLAYTFNSPTWIFSTTAGANTRYSPQVNEDLTVGGSAGVGVSGPLWRGSRLTSDASISYQPYYSLALLPGFIEPPLGDAPPFVPEYAALSDDYLNYNGRFALSQSVSRRGSLGFSVDAQRSDFETGSRGSTTSIGASGGYTHNLAKGLGLRLGYGYRDSRADEGIAAPTVHTFDVGIDFNRAISFSRRTTLAFSTGSAAVSDSGEPRYHLTGSASLRHEIGRTWFAGAGYQRQVQFVAALGDNYLTDGASVTLAGLINRKVQFHSQGSVGFAHSGTSSGGYEFDTYLGSVGIQYAVTRTVALGVDYAYYHYEFAPGSLPPPGFARNLGRQSLRAHVSFWTPLFYKARRPDAPR